MSIGCIGAGLRSGSIDAGARLSSLALARPWEGRWEVEAGPRETTGIEQRDCGQPGGQLRDPARPFHHENVRRRLRLESEKDCEIWTDLPFTDADCCSSLSFATLASNSCLTSSSDSSETDFASDPRLSCCSGEWNMSHPPLRRGSLARQKSYA